MLHHNVSHWQDGGQQFTGIHRFMIVVAKPEQFLALMDTIVPLVKAGMSKRSAFARSGKSDRVFRRLKSIYYLQQIKQQSYDKVSNNLYFAVQPLAPSLLTNIWMVVWKNHYNTLTTTMNNKATLFTDWKILEDPKVQSWKTGRNMWKRTKKIH